MDPVKLEFTTDELTRMTVQVREHNQSDNEYQNISMCICRECDTVRAFMATGPILDKVNKANAQTALVQGVTDLLNGLLGQLIDDEDDEPAENTPADETPTGESTPADDGWCPFCQTVHNSVADEKAPAAE